MRLPWRMKERDADLFFQRAHLVADGAAGEMEVPSPPMKNSDGARRPRMRAGLQDWAIAEGRPCRL